MNDKLEPGLYYGKVNDPILEPNNRPWFVFKVLAMAMKCRPLSNPDWEFDIGDGEKQVSLGPHIPTPAEIVEARTWKPLHGVFYCPTCGKEMALRLQHNAWRQPSLWCPSCRQWFPIEMRCRVKETT